MSALLEKLEQDAFRKEIPFSGQFELITACNFHCRMCYLCEEGIDYRSKKSVLPASFWLNIARQAKESGMMVLGITGGETLLYPELKPLLVELTQMGFLISLNTNGSLFNEEWIQWFQKHPVTKINIPLYGASDETYQKLCHSPSGTFQKVLNNIDRLLESGQNVFLTTVDVPEIQQDIPEMEQIASCRGLTLHHSNYIYPNACNNICRISPEEVATKEYESILSHHKQDEVLNILLNREHLPVTQRNYPICDGGKSSFAVTVDGKLVPCVMMRSISIDLETHAFLHAWDECKQRMKETLVPDNCMTCQYAGNLCRGCKAAIQKEITNTGSVNYLCDIANALHQQIHEKDKK